MSTLRVLIIEGHHGVRSALERRLSRLPGIQLIGGIGTVTAAEGLIADLGPDVLVCDPRSVGSSPVEVIRALRAKSPAVVVLTTSLLDTDAADFISAGAAAVLLKGCSMEALCTAILTAARERASMPRNPFTLLGYGSSPTSGAGHAFAK